MRGGRVLLLAFLVLALLALDMNVTTVNAACNPSVLSQTLARSYDISNATGNGAQAAWEEQNYDLGSSDGYVLSKMRVMTSDTVGSRKLIEAGFTRDLQAPFYGNSFYRIYYREGANFYYSKAAISKAVGGAHTWHLWQLIYDSNTGGWIVYVGESLGNLAYKGISPPIGTSGRYIDVGLEVTGQVVNAGGKQCDLYFR